jgi:hypothetical protein
MRSASPLIRLRRADEHTVRSRQNGLVTGIGDEPKSRAASVPGRLSVSPTLICRGLVDLFPIRREELLVETSPTERSNRNDGDASTKDRDEGDCPVGIAQQCRSDPHTHRHDEHAWDRKDLRPSMTSASCSPARPPPPRRSIGEAPFFQGGAGFQAYSVMSSQLGLDGKGS